MSTNRPARRRSSSASRQSRRAALTFWSAVGLGVLCAAYVHFTRPILKPPRILSRDAVEIVADEVDTPRDPLAIAALPDEPWAAEATWIVRNGESTIFFNKWEPVEENKAIRLEPFAMVIPPKDEDPNGKPFTVAGDAAILRVQGSIDLTGAEPGRIVGGTVPGKVRLHGPDELVIDGSNFTFSEDAQRLWSDDDVEFQQGENSGRGHGIQLELFRVGQPDDFESIAVSGVRIFRLLRDVEMELILDDESGGPFAAMNGESAVAVAKTDSSDEPPTPTHVECDGSFTFDLQGNTARFDENVIARREVPDQEADWLECDTLEIEFQPETPEARQAAALRRKKIEDGTLTEDDGFQGIDEELQVKRLIAQGHERIAKAHSPSNGFVAQFDTLTYLAETGQTILRRDEGVIAQQDTSELKSPVIVLNPSEDDRPPTIVCQGAGALHHRDEKGELALTAFWREKLVRNRQPDGRDLIRLIGQAQVNQPQDEFTLAGDEVDLYLIPSDEEETKTRENGGAASPLVDSSRVKPDLLVARENVMLRGPELAADATTLNVKFVDAPKPKQARVRSRLDLAFTNKRIVRTSFNPDAEATTEVVATDNAAEDAESEKGEPAEKSAPDPIEMVASVINVTMTRPEESPGAEPTSARDPLNGDARILQVATEGGVVVRQRRDGEAEPLIIRGDRMRMINRGENKELVHIYGRMGVIAEDGSRTAPEPAQVHDGESDLWGMNINLDRAKNTAWVEGEGVLYLPANQTDSFAVLSESSPRPTETKATDDAEAKSVAEKVETSDEEETSRLQIYWTERMDFDGLKAVFLGNVSTRLNQDDISCEHMEVELVKRVNFADLGSNPAAADEEKPAEGEEDAQPEVKTVYCKDRVIVDGGEYKEDKLISRRHAEFSDLLVNNQTGATQARGPGLIKLWSLGEAEGEEEEDEPKDHNVHANVTADPTKDQWEYTHVEFAGTSEGNIHHLTTTFNKDVWAIYGPVSGHTQELDPHYIHRAPKEAGGMQSEHLTLTRHRATDTQVAYSEALAKGNVRLTGREFEGVADQVTFDESKDQYILKSFNNRDATIRLRGRGTQHGQEFTFYPKRNDLKVTNARGGEAVR